LIFKNSIKKFYKMHIPRDIINYISKYLTLSERKGFGKNFEATLSKYLSNPRNKNGYAKVMISYYTLPKKVEMLKKMVGSSFFYRNSKLDFQYILNLFRIDHTMYGELIMHPQWQSSIKLTNVILNPDLLSNFPKFENCNPSIHHDHVDQLFINWMYPYECGYLLPNENSIMNLIAKIKIDAVVMIKFLNERVKRLKNNLKTFRL